MADQPEIQQWHVTKPYLNLHCQLGEGPYFEAAANALRFVDIKKKQIHTVSLNEGPDSVTTIQLDVPVTVTANVEGYEPADKILIGLKYGVALLDRKTGQYEYLTKFNDGEDNQRLRSNDGGVDPHGRFWVGTMTDFGLGPFEPEGEQTHFPLSCSDPVLLSHVAEPKAISAVEPSWRWAHIRQPGILVQPVRLARAETPQRRALRAMHAAIRILTRKQCRFAVQV